METGYYRNIFIFLKKIKMLDMYYITVIFSFLFRSVIFRNLRFCSIKDGKYFVCSYRYHFLTILTRCFIFISNIHAKSIKFNTCSAGTYLPPGYISMPVCTYVPSNQALYCWKLNLCTLILKSL
jgi:hypothetical protein